jgi:flagellar motor switch protein FliM
VQFRYLINVFSHSGELRLTFSASELERQIKCAEARLSEQIDIVLQEQLQNEVKKSDICLTVTLGTEILSLEEISGLRPGRLIELSSTVAGSVTVWSGSVAACQGRLARNGDRLAVAISTVMA